MTGDIHGVRVAEDDLAELARGMRTMPAHPDVADGLATLSARGYRLVTLTNSPPNPGVPTPLRPAGPRCARNLAGRAVRAGGRRRRRRRAPPRCRCRSRRTARAARRARRRAGPRRSRRRGRRGRAPRAGRAASVTRSRSGTSRKPTFADQTAMPVASSTTPGTATPTATGVEPVGAGLVGEAGGDVEDVAVTASGPRSRQGGVPLGVADRAVRPDQGALHAGAADVERDHDVAPVLLASAGRCSREDDRAGQVARAVRVEPLAGGEQRRRPAGRGSGRPSGRAGPGRRTSCPARRSRRWCGCARTPRRSPPRRRPARAGSRRTPRPPGRARRSRSGPCR